MKQPSIEYFAGLFDGEGCISIYAASIQYNSRCKTPKFMLRLGLRMSDPRAIYLFREKFKTLVYFQKDKRIERYKPTYCITAFNNNAEKIIKELLPYLIVKQEEAKLALEFRNYMRESRCSNKVGFSRHPVPDYILQKRHSFVLKAKQLKARRIPFPSS